MSTQPESPSPAPAQPGSLSPEAQKIMAQAGLLPESPQNGQERVGPEAPKELEVDVGGGVMRRVSVEDLAESFRRSSTIAASEKAVQDRLAQLGELEAVRALQARIGSLDASRRQKVLSLLQGQADEPDVDDTDEQIVREAFGNGARNGDAGHGATPEIKELMRQVQRQGEALQALAAIENGRRRDYEFQTTGQRVDKLMDEFPALRGAEPAARMFAKDFIMATVASSPKDAPIEDMVRQAAARLQEVQARSQTQADEFPGVPTLPRREIPNGALTAKGLKSGLVRQLALDALRRPR